MTFHPGNDNPFPARCPPWMATAKALLGVREVPGGMTAPAIARMLAGLKAWWTDDETAWCGALAAHCMQDAGLAIPAKWYRALAWADWGRPVDMRTVLSPFGAEQAGLIHYGAIIVRERKGGGHVHFYVAPVRDRPGMYWGLGGNQDNQVCARAYPWAGVVAVRWPEDYPLVDYRGPDAMMAGDAKPAGSDA